MLFGAFAARTGVFQRGDHLGGDLDAFFLIVLRLGRFGVFLGGFEHGLGFRAQVGAGGNLGIFDRFDVGATRRFSR